MRSRWLHNLILLLVVGGVAAFLMLRPKPLDTLPKAHVVSTLAPTSFSKVSIESPTKKAVLLEKQNGIWMLVQPYKARASRDSVGQVLAVAAALSQEKFPASKAGQYGLDNPALKVRLDNEEFSFGIHHPVTGEQYLAYKDAIYLIPNVYSQSASIQVVEFVDKRPFAPGEYISGFDLSRLEQWESSRLNVDMVQGKWKVSSDKAKPNQNELNDWFELAWKHLTATSVEPYTPDGKTYPSLEVKLKSGKTVHFDKLQESPELLLARPDEGMLYHFPQDIGFSILNPPVGFRPE